MGRNKLSTAFVSSVKADPSGKPSRYADGGNLYLKVADTGTKSWIYRYRYLGKPREIRLGKYPAVSLADARRRRNKAEAQVEKGLDPSALRKNRAAEQKNNALNSFKNVALKWFEIHKKRTSEQTFDRNLSRLESFIFPKVGSLPINDIGPAQWLTVLTSIINGEKRVETARRTLYLVRAIYDYAIQIELSSVNPVATLSRSLPSHQPTHRAAVTDPKRLGEILHLIDTYWASETVRNALFVAPRLAVRPGELRLAKWADVSLHEATWTFVASKTHPEFVVPLSEQVTRVLQKQYTLTGAGEFVFPSNRRTRPQRPMSNNALLIALRTLGISSEEMSVHGLRATFKTLLLERLNYSEHLIEMQLAHAVKDIHGSAYHRAAFLDQRRQMMQRWSDYLEELTNAAR